MSTFESGFGASAKALNELTTMAKVPILSIHHPANHESSQSWLAKILPASTLNNLETRSHMGNYVIDRKSGEKRFEAMSIYVRVSTLQKTYWKSKNSIIVRLPIKIPL